MVVGEVDEGLGVEIETFGGGSGFLHGFVEERGGWMVEAVFVMAYHPASS